MVGIAEKISLLRTQAQMTQAAFAERLEVSRQTVSKWELGTAQPELDKLVAISELFRVSTDYLLKDPEPREPAGSPDRVMLRFLGCARDFDQLTGELIGILRDGVIDERESARIGGIVAQLNEISQSIEALRYYLTRTGSPEAQRGR